jgi:mxaJ protein
MGRTGGTEVKRFALVAATLLLSSCNLVGQRHITACADPNNLPFSNRAGEGFENKLAEMIASDLHAKLDYVWWAQRRGYVRNTLNETKCDFWPGIGSNVEMVATSRPYYRSTYMFVSRRSENLAGLTLDDPRLKHLRIGVQMIGNDATNTPPAHALASRGVIANVRGYMLYGDYRKPNPPADIIDAVARGDVDVALVWGPLAGYFAARSREPLRLEPVTPWLADMQWPMQFDISVGVQRNNQKLLKQIDEILTRRSVQIRQLLASYHVPAVPLQ